MSFNITLQRIGAVREHTNAHSLELIDLEGRDYSIVTMKGLYQPGDVVFYFPVDSILPEPVIDLMGLRDKLANGLDEHGVKRANRVKTVKLRGEISQGVMAKPSDLMPYILSRLEAGDMVGQDFAYLIGVQKYEPPVVSSKAGNLVPLPDMVSKYDIESAQNAPLVAQVLMDMPVYITEKIEGSHWGVTLDAEDKFTVFQRNYSVIELEYNGHDWHRVAREGGYEDRLKAIKVLYPHAKRVTMRGEIVGPGIQGNYYQIKDHRVYIFEVEIDGFPLGAAAFLETLEAIGCKDNVPALAYDMPLREWLDGKTIKDASSGKSLVNSQLLREGIVIKPMMEQLSDQIGRVILKYRDPIYLAKEK